MRIFNIKDRHAPADSIRVDRSTIYGNPFIMGRHGSREEVCAKFDQWVDRPEQAALREKAKVELRGRNLLCWCAPEQCHAEKWMCIANND